MIFSTNEGKEGGKERGRRKRKKENLLNVFFRSKNQRIFGGAEACPDSLAGAGV